MKRLLLYITLYCLFSMDVQSQSNDEIVLGKIDSIQSKILGEKRKIWVHVPDSGPQGLYAKQYFPVVYLLDGDAHFASVTGMIHQLSSVNGNTICPQMIIVAIPNTRRSWDLTPTKGDNSNPWVDSTFIANTGGGVEFMNFMEKELIPYIDSKYPTQDYRMLIGHSLGGLMAVHALFHHTELFNSYVSIDPSIWWSSQQLLKEIKNASDQKDYKGRALYLAIANTLAEGMDIESVQKDTSYETMHIRSMLELDQFFGDHPPNKLKFGSKYYPDDDHGSVPLIAEYDALRFIFQSFRYQLIPQEFMDPDSDMVEKIHNHYNKLKTEYGYDVKPQEKLIDQLGHQVLSMGHMKKAEGFFKMNVGNYPESSNAYQSLGDFYHHTGEDEKASENYKKVKALKANSLSKQ